MLFVPLCCNFWFVMACELHWKRQMSPHVSMRTSTLSQCKGRVPQPSITEGGRSASQGGASMTITQTQLHKAACFVTCNFGGGGVLHDNDNDADVTP